MKLQKLGGWASVVLVCGLTIVPGIMTIISRHHGITSPSAGIDPTVRMMAVYAASPVIFNTRNLFGTLYPICYLVLAMALQERMREKAPHLMHLAVIAAAISAALGITYHMTSISYDTFLASKDTSAFRAYLAMANSIGLTSDFARGWSSLLIGSAVLKTRALPRVLGWALLVDGVLYVCLQLNIGSWLSLIVFIWLAVILLRKQQPAFGQDLRTSA